MVYRDVISITYGDLCNHELPVCLTVELSPCILLADTGCEIYYNIGGLMKTLTRAAIFLTVLTLTAFSAGSEDRRQVIQQARITQGVVSGELSPAEAKKLRRQQRHIRRVERRAQVDGVVSPREEAKLERKQDRASRRIYRQKHDAQKR